MARPRKYTFPLSDLEGFEEIRFELASRPELDDFDIETAVITLKQRKQPYTAQPENLEKSLESLKRHISKNGIIAPVELSKREMSDILQISRPTVYKWINAGIIAPEVKQTFRGIDIYYFTTHSILERLEKLVGKQ